MIELRTLGPVDLRDATTRTVRAVLAQPKRFALLVYLCVESTRGLVRRDVVTALFWPELEGEHARGSLRSALHKLRAALGDVIVARGSEEIGINLPDGAVTCDAVEFERLLAAKQLDAALALYRGHFLEGFHVEDCSHDLEEWIDGTRRRLRLLASKATRQVAGDLNAAGDLSGAIDAARRAASYDSMDEEVIRELINLHDLNGDRAGALATFETFSARLRKDFEAEPSAETLSLVERVRQRRDVVHSACARELTASVPSSAEDSIPSLSPAPSRSVIAVASALLLVTGLGAWWSAHPRPEARAALTATDPDAVLSNMSGYLRRPLGAPTFLTNATLVYDATVDLGLLFGGAAGAHILNDVWTGDNITSPTRASWTLQHPIGKAPPPRSMHSAVYDSANDRMIVFGGGLGHSSPCANDVWVLENMSRRHGQIAWTALRPPGSLPEGRADAAAVYVASVNRMVVFGGHDCIARRVNDTWALTHANGLGGAQRWKHIAIGGPAPPPRSGAASVYDPALDRLIIVGGLSRDERLLSDVWALSPASSDRARWQQLTSVDGPHPVPTSYARAAWDNAGRQLMLFGGMTQHGTTNDLWILKEVDAEQMRWERASNVGPAPAPRIAAATIYAPARDRLVILGGQGDGAIFSDVWLVMSASRLVGAHSPQ